MKSDGTVKSEEYVNTRELADLVRFIGDTRSISHSAKCVCGQDPVDDTQKQRPLSISTGGIVSTRRARVGYMYIKVGVSVQGVSDYRLSLERVHSGGTSGTRSRGSGHFRLLPSLWLLRLGLLDPPLFLTSSPHSMLAISSNRLRNPVRPCAP